MAAFPENLPPVWKEKLATEKQKPYFINLTQQLLVEYQKGKKIFPLKENTLKALQAVDYPAVRVVIIGQDPYHGYIEKNGQIVPQAIGLSFGVPNEYFPKPPSLQNIFKELLDDLHLENKIEKSDLTGWASQGVLLLNTVLTVRANEAFSHRNFGWEQFTDTIIQNLSLREKPLVFILWGAAAQKKKSIIANHHFIIESPHPSPLSAHRGFFGSKPFSKTNEILVHKLDEKPIDWSKT